MTNIDQLASRLSERVLSIAKIGCDSQATDNDKGQPHEEPSTIGIIQIPVPPIRQLAGPPLALLPIQRLCRR